MYTFKVKIRILLFFLFFYSYHAFSEQIPSVYERRIKNIEELSDKIRSVELAIEDTSDENAISKLQDQLNSYRNELDSILIGSDISSDDEALLSAKTDLWLEAQEILRPVIQSLKRISEKPRRIERLKSDINSLNQKIDALRSGIQDVDFFMTTTTDQKTIETLYESRSRFEELIRIYNEDLYLMKKELEVTLDREKPFLYSTGRILSDFLKTKGKNFFYAILTSLSVLLILIGIRQFVLKPIFSYDRLYYFGRPVITIYSILMFLFSILAGLISLFIMNDWFLFIFFAIILGLFAWGFKNLLPGFFSAMRVIFQLGTIREGQRIIYDGCPWLVKKIGLKTTLVNDHLDGGKIIVGVEKIRGYVSRPLVDNEPLFPSKSGDYITLNDGSYGKVLAQTPEQVIVVLPGGTSRAYQLKYYLALSPRNISRGFEVESIIGVDLLLQKDIEKVINSFRTGMLKRLENNKLSSKLQKGGIEIQYDKKSESSLDISARIRFKGSAAPEYIELKRKISYFMLDICTENSFKVPYNQIVVHGAKCERD